MSEMQELAKQIPEPLFYAEYWQRTEYWKRLDNHALVKRGQYEDKDNGGTTIPDEAKRRGGDIWENDHEVIPVAIKRHQKWIDNRSSFPAAWDYVVLQSWQDVTDNPEAGYMKYATKFADLAKKQNTTPILYLSAPYSLNAMPVDEPIEAERALNDVRIAFELAKNTGALVVPVPLAVYRLQKAGAAITLRYENDYHPNQYCAYLTACLVYAAVFNKSPEGLELSEVVETTINRDNPGFDPDGGSLKRVFTNAERLLLQRTAWETMEAFRAGDF